MSVTSIQAGVHQLFVMCRAAQLG